MKKDKKKYGIIIAVVAAFICALIGTSFAVTVNEVSSDKIIRNLYIDNVYMGGMNREEAADILEKELSQRQINVILPDDGEMIFSYEDLGISYKTEALVNEAYKVGKSKSFGKNLLTVCRSLFVQDCISMGEYVEKNEPSKRFKEFIDGYAYEPTKSQYEIQGDKVVVTNGMNGEEIAEDKLISDIAEAGLTKSEFEAGVNILPFEPINVDEIYNKTASNPHSPYGRNNDGSITATVKSFNLDIARKIQAENAHEGAVYEFVIDGENVAVLDDENLYPEILGEGTTEFDIGYTSRVNNLKIAAGLINGTALLPGEEFSFNKNNGEITKEKGYMVAKGYANGTVVDTVGAGVCQVSSTLYNAALYSGMEIVMRSSHSLPVAYLPLGQDAAISYPKQDFAFKNNMETPVKIFAWVEGGELTVQIKGVSSEEFDEIVIENSTVSVIAPSVKEVADSSLAPGQRVVTQKGSSGYVVKSQRVYYKEGTEIKREDLSKSTYKAQDKIIKVGAVTDEQNNELHGEP